MWKDSDRNFTTSLRNVYIARKTIFKRGFSMIYIRIMVNYNKNKYINRRSLAQNQCEIIKDKIIKERNKKTEKLWKGVILTRLKKLKIFKYLDSI